jgi:hypothetical protein
MCGGENIGFSKAGMYCGQNIGFSTVECAVVKTLLSTFKMLDYARLKKVVEKKVSFTMHDGLKVSTVTLLLVTLWHPKVQKCTKMQTYDNWGIK